MIRGRGFGAREAPAFAARCGIADGAATDGASTLLERTPASSRHERMTTVVTAKASAAVSTNPTRLIAPAA
jgi:hypothetical protein